MQLGKIVRLMSVCFWRKPKVFIRFQRCADADFQQFLGSVFSVNCHENSQSKNSATQTFYSVVDKTRNRNWILERRKFQFLVPTSALLNDIVCISLLMLTRFCLLAQKCDWFHVRCFWDKHETDIQFHRCLYQHKIPSRQKIKQGWLGSQWSTNPEIKTEF